MPRIAKFRANLVFVFGFSIESLGVSHNAPQFCSPPSPPYPISSLLQDHHERKQNKISKQASKQKQEEKPPH